MATSSDHDDRPETDDDASDDDAADAADDAKGEEAGDGEERKAPAAKPAKAPRAAAAGKRPAKPIARPAPPPPPRVQGGSLGKSLILFLIIIGGLAGAFAFFSSGPTGTGAAANPKWKDGQKVDVEITLVADDIKKLACWSPQELNGRHCAFEAPTKGWPTGDADDAKLLRPYTTTDGAQLLAAGVWSQPAMTAGKLPSARFAIKCGFTVEGKLKRPGIRWSSEGAWLDRTDDLYAGVVSDCKLINVAGK